MATKEQWEVFKFLLVEESQRYNDLNDKGKIYISIIAIYLGAIAFKIDQWIPIVKVDKITTFFFVAALISFIGALFTTIVAMGIYSYEGINDPEDILDSFGDEPQTNAEFFDNRIVDATVATNRNIQKNNFRAKLLYLSSTLIGIAILSHAITILLTLYKR